jgi:hypothetical protein
VDDSIESIVRFELENRFYYLFIEWPENPVPPDLWKDREEKLQTMTAMSLDHLKASIRLVEKDLKEFLQQRGGSRGHKEAVNILELAASTKLKELKSTFREKAEI